MIRPVTGIVRDLGGCTLFCWLCVRHFFRYGVRFQQVIDQMYVVGVRSLGITLVSGLFVGAIMAIQLNLMLKDFGATGFMGGLSTSVIIRNVGPVLIAFMLSGKVGAYTAAELGTMKITEQIDAIRCLGANPIQFIILPRMIAVVFSSFLLLIIGLMVAIGGGILISGFELDINPVNYVHTIPRFVTPWSLGTGILKSFIFGVIISTICCYRGYTTTGGAVGVGITVKKAAVEILVCIIVADFTLSALSNYTYDFLRIGQL